MKICIVGAGSSYTPELFEKLSEMRAELPVREIALMDIDAERLDAVHGFCVRYAAHLNLPVRIDKSVDLEAALSGASFVITQMRVGGNKARYLDEKIPLSYGLIGQETTGAGGFMKALRTVPKMIAVAKAVEKVCPDAWIINYTNPTGIVAEGVNRYTNAKIAGLCAGGVFARHWAAKALDVPPEAVRFDIAGLNHMNFSYNLKIHGTAIDAAQFRKIAEHCFPDDVAMCERLGALPTPYIHYYFHTSRRVREISGQDKLRSQQVMELEQAIYRDYRDPACHAKPASLAARGGGGYSDVALGLMSAIHNDRDTWMVVNVPNQGVLEFLPDDAVIETACMVNAAGVRPLAVAPVPRGVRGLISAVKNYEQLAVEAAVTGDVETAKLALMAHPLVRDVDIIEPMLKELLEANRAYLPAFR